MSYHGRNTNRNRFSEINMHKYTNISKYVERITEWRLWPATCISGEVFINFHNHLIPYKEFMEIQPQPIVHNFNSDHSNVDKTKAFML